MNIGEGENSGREGPGIHIPRFVRSVFERLAGAGYDVWVVGGAVRDAFMGRPVSDWDLATSAGADEIQSVFRDVRSFRLKHYTVTLVQKDRSCQVTPFRGGRGRPLTIEQDLAHRDFTLNAMAYDPVHRAVLDPQGGLKDISRRLVRAVGRPADRFAEDPLRLLRAVRFAAAFEFVIEKETLSVMAASAGRIVEASPERVREEVMGILLSIKPSTGLRIMLRTGLLKQVMPELTEGHLKRQNEHHRFTILRHAMETVDRVPPFPALRWAALLHDVAKPRVRRKVDGRWRFIAHTEASADLAEAIMERLRLDREIRVLVSRLVRHHMIGYDPEWSDAGVRRFVRRVGPDLVEQLIALRKADILAHGKAALRGWTLEELEARINNIIDQHPVLQRPDLALNGRDIMEITGLSPGPRVGEIISLLMERVIDDPSMNTEENLQNLLRGMLRIAKKKGEIHGAEASGNKT